MSGKRPRDEETAFRTYMRELMEDENKEYEFCLLDANLEPVPVTGEFLPLDDISSNAEEYFGRLENSQPDLIAETSFSHKTAAAGSASQKTAAAGSASQKTAAAGSASQKTAAAGSASQKTAAAGSASQKTAAAGSASQKTAAAGTTSTPRPRFPSIKGVIHWLGTRIHVSFFHSLSSFTLQPAHCPGVSAILRFTLLVSEHEALLYLSLVANHSCWRKGVLPVKAKMN